MTEEEIKAAKQDEEVWSYWQVKLAAALTWIVILVAVLTN